MKSAPFRALAVESIRIPDQRQGEIIDGLMRVYSSVIDPDQAIIGKTGKIDLIDKYSSYGAYSANGGGFVAIRDRLQMISTV